MDSENYKNLSFQADDMPEGKIIRMDDHAAKISAYFSITSVDFPFNNYDYGSREMKQAYRISKPLNKYFNKRFFLFHKFQDGIQIDQESWFSVIPQDVSMHLLKRMKSSNVKRIFEPFCGVGGIAIHLCNHFEEYAINDIDPNKISMLKHNLSVYKKNESMVVVQNKDFLQIQPFETDAMLICPPWGGINTDEYSMMDLDELMEPKLSDILNLAMQYTPNIMLQMPKNTNIQNLIKVFHKCQLPPIFTIEKIKTNGNSSQLFIYLGKDSFTGINSCLLYKFLYSDLEKEEKAERRKIKVMVKEDGVKVMREVYKKKFPKNRHLFFT